MRDLSCWTVDIHACSNKSTSGTLRVFSGKPERRFQTLTPERNQIARPSNRCLHRGLKNERKDSTNVRHAVIARDAKESTSLCSQASSMFAAYQRRRKRLNRSHAQASAPWVRLPKEAQKIQTRLLAKNDRLIKKRCMRKTLE